MAKPKRITDGFWKRQRGLYLSAWKAMWQWKTLLHVALDVSLIIFALVLITANSLFFSALAQPLMPTLQAIGQLESSDNPYNPVTNEERIALLEQYRPDINGLILKAGIITITLYLVFVLFYVLVKTRIWTSLKEERFVWRTLKKNLFLTLVWLLLLAAIPIGLLFLSPVASALILVLLMLFTMGFLPLFYATNNWKRLVKTIWWRPFGNYLFILLMAFLSWILVANIIGLLSLVSQDAYAIIFIIWLLAVTAWIRYYIKGFVGMYPEEKWR